MNRNFLAHSTGDAVNAVLAAAGYNFCLLLRWLRLHCALILAALFSSAPASLNLKAA
jgi:IS5 family transposase